jgi:hypothetical protein
LALTLPLLILFALAATDFGRVVHAHVAVGNAARAGAVHGSMHNYTSLTEPQWRADIEQAIREELQGMKDFDDSKLEVTVTTADDGDDLFRVAGEVRYPFTTVISWPGFPAEIVLFERSEMRQIR